MKKLKRFSGRQAFLRIWLPCLVVVAAGAVGAKVLTTTHADTAGNANAIVKISVHTNLQNDWYFTAANRDYSFGNCTPLYPMGSPKRFVVKTGQTLTCTGERFGSGADFNDASDPTSGYVMFEPMHQGADLNGNVKIINNMPYGYHMTGWTVTKNTVVGGGGVSCAGTWCRLKFTQGEVDLVANVIDITDPNQHEVTPDDPTGSGTPTNPSGDTTTPKANTNTSTTFSTSNRAATPAVSSILDTAPSAPTNFKATSNSGSSAISLSWNAATSTSPVHYVLERSTDNQNWTVLSQVLGDTSYNDYDTQFSTHYFYRVTAVDGQNQVSPSVVTGVTSSVFVANAAADKRVVLTSKDKMLRVTIPGNAVKEPANCSLNKATDLPKLNAHGKQLVSEPYQLNCQQADGSMLKQFSDSVDVAFTPSTKLSKSYTNFELQTYLASKNAWVTTEAQPNSKGIYELSTDNIGLAALAKPQSNPWWVKPLIGLVSLIALVFIGLQIIRINRRRKQALALQQDYWRQQQGL
jgi:hypothetical protein